FDEFGRRAFVKLVGRFTAPVNDDLARRLGIGREVRGPRQILPGLRNAGKDLFRVNASDLERVAVQFIKSNPRKQLALAADAVLDDALLCVPVDGLRLLGRVDLDQRLRPDIALKLDEPVALNDELVERQLGKLLPGRLLAALFERDDMPDALELVQ